MRAVGEPEPEIVASWPCRDCKAPVALTSAGADAFASANKQLRKRGEKPLDSTQVLRCAHCVAAEKAGEGDRNAAWSANVNRLVAELRATRNPLEAARLTAELRRSGAPGIASLIESITGEQF